ncbi:MAG: ATP-binding cassette domain-containing protein [Bacteroidales bacterium]|jgi:ABC-2 type transport system ATP-binding protein|nr:ATP-binding cassette domain-containing protein [Bacteroidales bacterium]
MIKINNLSYSYTSRDVFNGLSVELKSGKIYGLLGENGVGKSTLLKLMSGILKNEGDAINMDGKNPWKRTPETMSELYYLPEDFTGPSNSIENVAYGFGKFYRNFSMDKLHDILKSFDLKPDSVFTKLSYGQQKKGMIAIALSLGTRYLFLDEPTNGLDIPSKVSFRQLVAGSLNEEKTIIISSHQVRDLDSLIDPVIIMDRNEIILNEEMGEIEKRLAFRLENRESAEALFSQQVINGFINVYPNGNGEITNIDTEVLFNMAIKKRETIKEIFKNE